MSFSGLLVWRSPKQPRKIAWTPRSRMDGKSNHAYRRSLPNDELVAWQPTGSAGGRRTESVYIVTLTTEHVEQDRELVAHAARSDPAAGRTGQLWRSSGFRETTNIIWDTMTGPGIEDRKAVVENLVRGSAAPPDVLMAWTGEKLSALA